MANIFDAASAVLGYTEVLSSTRLQHLLYLCQCQHLASIGMPLFAEDFQAWSEGPISPELSVALEGSSWVSAEKIYEHMSDGELSQKELATIKETVGHFADVPGNVLAQHLRLSIPWRAARYGYPEGAPCLEVLPKGVMREAALAV